MILSRSALRSAHGGDDYFQAAELTRQLMAALEAFARGEKSSAELEAWAHSVWPTTGTQEGPIASNALATRMLINAWNADVHEGQTTLLRIDDALAYLSTLRRGDGKATPRLIERASNGSATASFCVTARRPGLTAGQPGGAFPLSR